MINYDVPLNSRGNNANIKAGLVSDEIMVANGFRRRTECWYYMENLGYDISLNISILGDTVAIDVIYEEFLQPYDYQRYLKKGIEHKVTLGIYKKVQATMKRLGEQGIIVGYVANDYI